MSNINRWQKIDITPSSLRNMYEVDEMTIPKIAKQLSASHITIKKMLLDIGVTKRSNKEDALIGQRSRLKFANINKDFRSVINGCLLGDGCIVNKTNRQAYYQHSDRHEDYILFLEDCFNTYGIKTSVAYVAASTDKRGVKSKEGWVLRSKSYVDLLNIYRQWYVPHKKVPKDFKIDKVSFIHWWIGDGYLNKKHGWGSLATHGFTFEENIFLIKQLQTITKNNICTQKHYDKYYIYLSRKAINDLLDYVGESPIESYSYKWRKHA